MGIGKKSSTTNLDRRLKVQQVRLLQENISGSATELSDLGLGELDLLARSTSDFQKPIDDVVQNLLLHLTTVWSDTE